jgi:ubiquinone biosynthesis protein UbiJ
MFEPADAAGFVARYELRLGEDRFRVQVAGDHIELARGTADAPDAIVETDPATLGALVYGGRQLDDAVRCGELVIHGDPTAVERFVGLFPLPVPAPLRPLRGQAAERALAHSYAV